MDPELSTVIIKFGLAPETVVSKGFCAGAVAAIAVWKDAANATITMAWAKWVWRGDMLMELNFMVDLGQFAGNCGLAHAIFG
jgi:hypothetical protein